jgi:hypothetical protein
MLDKYQKRKGKITLEPGDVDNFHSADKKDVEMQEPSSAGPSTSNQSLSSQSLSFTGFSDSDSDYRP